MPGFLNWLAARALGALPVAEPLVRARFDPGVEHVALSPFELAHRDGEPFEAVAEAGDHDLRDRGRSSGIEQFDALAGSRTKHRHLLQFQDTPQHFTNEPHTSWPDAQSARALVSISRRGFDELEDAVPRNAESPMLQARPVFAEPKPSLINPAPEPSRGTGQQQRPGMPGSHGAAPIVRVSIGRIEVRAELPPPVHAPVQQRGRVSHVSLEQFLKQASGGGRR